MAKDNWPTATPTEQTTVVDKPAKAKRLQYTGPNYRTSIVLPGFAQPTDPRSWDVDTIKSYTTKHPALHKYFAEK